MTDLPPEYRENIQGEVPRNIHEYAADCGLAAALEALREGLGKPDLEPTYLIVSLRDDGDLGATAVHGYDDDPVGLLAQLCSMTNMVASKLDVKLDMIITLPGTERQVRWNELGGDGDDGDDADGDVDRGGRPRGGGSAGAAGEGAEERPT